MYLVSIYFDEKTDKHIRGFIKQVAKKTGNTYMLDGNVPPHITIAAFEAQETEIVIKKLEQELQMFRKGKITWASVGIFLPYVIYLTPVLDQNLHNLSVAVNEVLKEIPDIKLRPNYQPFHWMPHTTIAKKLSPGEMRNAFEVLQNSFGMFSGEIVRIGLAKTNPYEELISWELK